MNTLFLTRIANPHVGGVERHIHEVKKILERGGNVKVISEADIKYPKVIFFGLVYIWFWFFRNRKLIQKTDIVHIHDVFVWYLPFRFLYPNKRTVTTVHGLEFDNPTTVSSLIQKKLAVRLSDKSVGVGHFLEKYIGVKFNLISYGAAHFTNKKYKKIKNTVLYVGRLEENTGILSFLKWLDKNPKYKVEFCGDGPLRSECEKYGKVHGFCNPDQYYKKAEIAVPGGYLAALEALSFNCKLKLFWNNKIKEDYWKMSPFYKLKGDELKKWAKKQTWEKLANEYLDLYNSTK
jgi:glycosyltransferase involved in cell wall biosynthesis